MDEKLVAFANTADPEAARAFYGGVLGLSLVSDDDHLLVFSSGEGRLNLVKGQGGTTLGWQVRDLRATVRALTERGVAFERFQLEQDELGIWSPVPGHGVAWFFDPDHNLLSVAGPI